MFFTSFVAFIKVKPEQSGDTKLKGLHKCDSQPVTERRYAYEEN